ncbi:MAG: hypothetical protein ACE5EX_10290 [Phycisphaerae bacterium]
MTVTVIENGKLAAEAVLSVRDRGRPHNIILIGLQMPVMHGHAVTRFRRHDGDICTIIAPSTRAVAGDRAICVGIGYVEDAARPIDRTRRIEMIQGFTQCVPANMG